MTRGGFVADRTSGKGKMSSKPVNFGIYIHRILRQVHPGMCITRNAKEQMNLILTLIGNLLVNKSLYLTSINCVPSRTITSRDILFATKLIIQGELGVIAEKSIHRAVNKFVQASSEKTAASGLTLHPARADKLLRGNGKRVAKTACIALASVLEYICAEILELASTEAFDAQHKTVRVRDIYMAVQKDDELNRLFSRYNIVITGAGTMTHSQPSSDRENEGRLEE